MHKFIIIIENLLAREGTRLFLLVPIFISMGIGIYFNLRFEPSFSGFLITIILVFFYFVFRKLQLHLPIFFLLAVLLMSLGFSTAQFRQNIKAAPILEKKIYLEFTAEIDEISFGKSGSRVTFKNIIPSINDVEKIRLNVRTGDEDLSPGAKVRLKAFLLPPPMPTHPGAYDYQRDLYFKSIGAVVYAVTKPVLIDEDLTENGISFKKISAYLRYEIGQIILNIAPQDSRGFLLAVMIGEKRFLDKTFQENMRKSGLAHLLAISGLHMVMIGGLVFYVIRFLASTAPALALNYPIKKWAAIAAIISVSGYLLVSGLAVSAIRAYIMIVMVLTAVCFDRTVISLRNVSIAAIVILLILPESLFSASFQMSFAAVTALVACYEKMGRKLFIFSEKTNVLTVGFLYFLGVALTSLIATFATSVFSVFHFGQFSIAGIVVNLLAVPLMGFWIMPCVVITFLLLPLGLSDFPMLIGSYGISAIEILAHWGANFTYSTINVPSVSPVFLLGLVLAFLMLIIFRTRIKYGAALFLCVAIIVQWQHVLPDVLVSDTGKIVMFRTFKNSPQINNRRTEKFVRSRWQEYFGISDFELFSTQNTTTRKDVICDPLGCAWQKETQFISYSQNPLSLRLDCVKSTILIATQPISIGCNKPDLTIDRFDLWRDGAHAIYLQHGEKPFVTTVNGVRGDRPWVPNRKRK